MSVLVLAGGGHSHALLLRRWAMRPEQRPDGLVILVSQRSTTLYSGMIPGLIAGRYRLDEVSIDLRRLADQAGVALVNATITGIDLAGRQLLLKHRPALRFDRLSINVGAKNVGIWEVLQPHLHRRPMANPNLGQVVH